MKTVKEILPKLKANCKTYHNLDKRTIEDFKRNYSYLKKHENKAVSVLWFKEAEKQLSDNSLSMTVRKIKAMQVISNAIIH